MHGAITVPFFNSSLEVVHQIQKKGMKALKLGVCLTVSVIAFQALQKMGTDILAGTEKKELFMDNQNLIEASIHFFDAASEKVASAVGTSMYYGAYLLVPATVLCCKTILKLR